jgi:hypothetical protein
MDWSLALGSDTGNTAMGYLVEVQQVRVPITYASQKIQLLRGHIEATNESAPKRSHRKLGGNSNAHLGGVLGNRWRGSPIGSRI